MIAPSAIDFDEELGITACSEPIPIPIPTLVSEPAQAEHTRASIRARDGPEPKVGMTVAVKYDDGKWYEGQIGKVIGARKVKGGADTEGKSRKRKRMFIEYEDGDTGWEEWPGDEIKVRDEGSAAATAVSVKAPVPAVAMVKPPNRMRSKMESRKLASDTYGGFYFVLLHDFLRKKTRSQPRG